MVPDPYATPIDASVKNFRLRLALLRLHQARDALALCQKLIDACKDETTRAGLVGKRGELDREWLQAHQNYLDELSPGKPPPAAG
jgi:hypothetical protein